MKRLFLCLVLALLMGCATTQVKSPPIPTTRPQSSPIPTGERVTAPHGWTDYQQRGGE